MYEDYDCGNLTCFYPGLNFGLYEDYSNLTLFSLGLKFGLYEDYGNLTCGGYPGVLQNMELDAKTFAGT
jgi:hypothetical protein